MNKKNILPAVFCCFLIFSCENQWMIDILPDKTNNGDTELLGTALLAGDYKIGGTITVNTGNITIKGTVTDPDGFQYQWKTNNADVNTAHVSNDGTEYIIQGSDAGKIITCIITHPEAANSITASFNNNAEVPFILRINLVNLFTDGINNGYNDVSFTEDFNFPFDYTGAAMEEIMAVSGSSIPVYYKLKGSHLNNVIEFIFGTSDPVTLTTEQGTGIDGTSPYIYTVNRNHASQDGIITIRVYSIHTDAEILDTPHDIELAKDGTITFTPGANNIAAGCTYTYRLYRNDVNVGGAGTDIIMSPAPVQIGTSDRYTVTIPALVTEMLESGAGEYTVRIKAHSTNPDFSNDSLQSVNSASVYVRTLTVNITGADGTSKVKIDDNGVKYYPGTPSEYNSTFTLNVFEGTEIELTAAPDDYRGIIWSGDGAEGADTSKRIIIIGSANCTVTAAFTPNFSSFTINFEVSGNSAINWFITNNNTPAAAITINRTLASQVIDLTGITGSVHWEFETRDGIKSGTDTAPLTINPSALFTQLDAGPTQLYIKVTVGTVDYETTIPVIITN